MKLNNLLEQQNHFERTPKRLPDERFRRFLLDGRIRFGENSASHFNYDVDSGQEVIMKLPDTNGRPLSGVYLESFAHCSRPFRDWSKSRQF